MKHVLVIASLILAANFASAKTLCGINTDPHKDMAFDRTLFSAEISSPTYVLVKKGAQAAEEVELSQFDTYAKWKAINGATIVTFSAQQNGQFGITVAHVDISKSKNMLPLDVMASGPVDEQKFLHLVLPQKNLSLICGSSK